MAAGEKKSTEEEAEAQSLQVEEEDLENVRPIWTTVACVPDGTAGASQPGGSPWEGSVFLTRTLRQNQQTLRRDCPQLHLARTPQEAIDQANSHARQDPVEDFYQLPPVTRQIGGSTGIVTRVLLDA